MTVLSEKLLFGGISVEEKNHTTDEITKSDGLSETNETDITEENNADGEKENAHETHSSHHGHHHHHHHHHHRHRHRHSRRSRHSRRKRGPSDKENKFKKFLKRNKHLLVNIFFCSVALVLLIILAMDNDASPSGIGNQGDTVEITQSTVKIESSVYLDDISLAHEAVFAYISDTNTKSAKDIYRSYSGHENLLNVGLPVKYYYRVSGLPSNTEVSSALLEVSENEDHSDSWKFELDLGKESIDIYNLKTGIKYFYRLTLTLSNGKEVSTSGDFSTVASPRILNIDGIVNVRDIGGWKTLDGKTVQQGLLFRGSELDGAVEPSYLLTEKGRRDMILRLGVRYDLDLRSSSVNPEGTDALGQNVTHKYYPMCMYSEIFNDANKETVRNIFAALADESNYPMYMHCTYGRDRTGTVCYLLGALLGVSEDDLTKDYELSALTDSYVNTEEFTRFIVRIDLLEGDTLAEKVEGYLLSIGVTQEEISNIRKIFLG